jgi:hypothetical protein
MAGLAFAGATAFEAGREAGVAERADQREHSALSSSRLDTHQPVAASAPAPPVESPPVRLHATTTTVPVSSPATTVPPTVAPPVDEPLLSTTTSALPRVLADPEEQDCVVDLGGLGIPAGVLCGSESP